MSLMHKDVIQIHIDIETLDKLPTALILSIGAVNDCTNDTFYIEVDLEDQGPRTIGIDTLKWWLEQPTEMPIQGIVKLFDALTGLATYIRRLRPFPESKIEVWVNGLDFDVPILINAYNNCGIPVPWKYNEVRDFRTVRKLFLEIQDSERVNHHNALADAQWQMEHLNRCLQYLQDLETE